MQSFRDHLQERTLDLLWSLWTELGVSGWSRRHAQYAIDPEPLILLTAALSDADARLRDESLDWCIRYGRYVSANRLRNLLRTQWHDVAEQFGEYAAIVSTRSALSWPGATTPRKYEPTGRSRVDDFTRPALIVLRLRALFGVSARAEIIRFFVSQPDISASSADLAQSIKYTKRNVDKALEGLRMAGIVEARPVRNQLLHRLVDAGALLDFLRERPTSYPESSSIFRVLHEVLRFALDVPDADVAVRSVEARALMRKLGPDLERGGLQGPQPETAGEPFWMSFERWSRELATALAAGELEPGKRPALRRAR